MARQVSDSLALEGRARLRCKARRRHDWTQCRIITDKPAAASIAVNGGATPATPLGQGVGHYHLLASQAHSSPSYRPPRNASRPSRCLSPSFLCRHSFNPIQTLDLSTDHSPPEVFDRYIPCRAIHYLHEASFRTVHLSRATPSKGRQIRNP